MALDSAFVPAWARLSQALSRLHSRTTPSAEMAERALSAANRAQTLGPTRSDGALALGDYYRRVAFEPARAMAVLEAGLKLAPNNVDLLAAAGDAEESLGRWSRRWPASSGRRSSIPARRSSPGATATHC